MLNRNDKKHGKTFLSEFFSRVRGLFLKLWKLAKLLWEAGKKKPLVTLTGLIFLANLVFVYFNLQSNKRAGKLFVGQNKPLIDVTPIRIIPGISEVGKDKPDMAATMFSIVNYSGFVAYNIVIDVAYGGNVWISEWVKAKDDNEKEKKGVVVGKPFLTTPKAFKPEAVLTELKPGKTKKTFLHIGTLDLEKTVCCEAGFDGHTVLVRATWENGHVFDEIHKYKLICTKKDLGRAFTFIPKGIISQKD